VIMREDSDLQPRVYRLTTPTEWDSGKAGRLRQQIDL
jgi:hypothetical protein